MHSSLSTCIITWQRTNEHSYILTCLQVYKDLRGTEWSNVI